MATGYWRGADNATWNTTTNWWTTIGGTTTVATVPGAGEIAFFNANGTTTARTVYLNSSRSLGTFWMNGNAQGDITLRGGVSGGETTQTLTLGGIDMSGTSANAIFSSSVNVALANAQSWSIGSGRAILVSGVISGAFKLTSNNSGVIILGNANTYSGGTDISAGTVRVGNNQALGTGAGSTITMTGGTLSSDSTSARTLANALSLNGTMTLGNATNTGALTFSGTTTLLGNTALTIPSAVTLSGVVAGAFNFTKAGANTLTLGAANTVSGTTQVTAGTLTLSNVNGLQNSTVDWGTSTVGTLSLPASAVLGGLSTASGTLNTFTQNGAYSVGNNNASATFGGVLAGTGAITKIGTGSWTLTGNNTNSGAISVSAGTLNANSTTALGAASSTAAISVTSGATLSLGGASNITYSSRTVALAGTGVSNAGALVVANAVTNTFSGIALTAGTLVRASESGTLTAPVTTNSHNLTFTVAAGKTLTLPSTSVISASTSTVSYNTVSGDTGTAVVSAQNLYTNPTVISQGTVRVGASYVGSPGSVTSGPLGRGQLTWNGGALDASTTATLGNNVVLGGDVSFSGTAALTLAGTVSLGASRTITTNGSGGVLTLSGVVSGTLFGITKAGTNSLILSGNNTYTGFTTLDAGTLIAGRATNAFGLGGSPSFTGGLFINGGTLDASVAATVDLRAYLSADFAFAGTADFKISTLASISLSTAASSVAITTNGSGILWFDAPVGEPSGIKGIVKKGNGILRLSADPSSYRGGTEIQAGTLQAGGGGWGYSTGQYLGTVFGVTISSSTATLQTMTSLNQRGRLTIPSLTNSAGGTIKIGG